MDEQMINLWLSYLEYAPEIIAAEYSEEDDYAALENNDRSQVATSVRFDGS
jgi:hypothetical protein